MNKAQHQADMAETKLKTLDVDVCNPLSSIDWRLFSFVVQ
jgi:hypothetical protein